MTWRIGRLQGRPLGCRSTWLGAAQHRVFHQDLKGSHLGLPVGPRSTWLRREKSIWGRSMLLGMPSVLRHHQGQHHVLLSTRHHCGT